MKIKSLILHLDSNSKTVQDLLINTSEEDQKWKPAPEKWCLLEIISHLYDEEIHDFKARLDKILKSDHNWDPIDPEGWVVSRNYMDNNFSDTLDNFIDERKKSVKWLNDLEVKDWNVKAVHPNLGEFTAYQMLGNWLAHDYLHMRQILKVRYQILEKDFDSSELKYAGDL